MNFFERLVEFVRRGESWLGDAWMNVQTAHSAEGSVVQGEYGDSHRFQTNSHLTIRSAIKAVQPGPKDTVVVLGCAKGRAVCHFARLNVNKVIGVEISPPLAQAAQENVRRLRGRRARVEIHNLDAAKADLSEASMVYMFNPFGPRTLREVLASLDRSHRHAARPLTIIYVNPVYAGVFEEFPWLKPAQKSKRFTGLEVMLFRFTAQRQTEPEDHLASK
jgi:SAM-dependent methyltransferase